MDEQERELWRRIATARAARRKPVPYACAVCSTPFHALPRTGPAAEPRYCSSKCKQKAWREAKKGKPTTRISLVSRAQPPQ